MIRLKIFFILSSQNIFNFNHFSTINNPEEIKILNQYFPNDSKISKNELEIIVLVFPY